MEEGEQYTPNLLDVYNGKAVVERQGIPPLSPQDPVAPVVFHEWLAGEHTICSRWQASGGV